MKYIFLLPNTAKIWVNFEQNKLEKIIARNKNRWAKAKYRLIPNYGNLYLLNYIVQHVTPFMTCEIKIHRLIARSRGRMEWLPTHHEWLIASMLNIQLTVQVTNTAFIYTLIFSCKTTSRFNLRRAKFQTFPGACSRPLSRALFTCLLSVLCTLCKLGQHTPLTPNINYR